jgi:nucleoside 2-deoxyribosyltransferase
MKIYVAGKNQERAQKVMSELVEQGYTIAYDWVAHMSDGPTKEKAIIEAEAVRDADLLVYLWEPVQESARYEAGMAMGLGKPIVVSGKTDAFFFQLENVHPVNSDDDINNMVKDLAAKLTT